MLGYTRYSGIQATGLKLGCQDSNPLSASLSCATLVHCLNLSEPVSASVKPRRIIVPTLELAGSIILGWPKSPFSFFCKIKDMVFIFTNNFIDLDILRMSAVSGVL